MAYYGLEHSYSKFSGKKVKEQLSSFLPNLPGVIDGPGQIVSCRSFALLCVCKKYGNVWVFFEFIGERIAGLISIADAIGNGECATKLKRSATFYV